MRRRILLTYVVLISFITIVIGGFSLSFTSRNYLTMMQERLHDNGQIIGQYILNNREAGSVDELCRDIKKRLGIRLTILTADGDVIGDSDANIDTMQNHRNRPEVQKALKGETGRAIRYSNTLATDMMYVAIPVDIDGQLLILRTAMPLTQVYNNLRSQLRNITIALLFAFLIALYQASRFSTYLTRPILEMVDISDKIAKGDFSRKVQASTKDEIAKLAEAFNSMAEKLEHNIAQLRDKNLELESILTNIIDGIIVLDDQYRIILINPAACRLFNIEGEVIGKYFLEVLMESRIDRLVEQVIDNNEKSSIEIVLKKEDSSKILKISGAPMENVKGKRGAILLIQDITEIRQLEEVRKDFVANVSHELKTPLTSIQGFVETLQSGALENKEVAYKFLNIIQLEADRLSRLINDILSLSELESGKGNKLVEKINLVEIVQDTLEMMKSHAKVRQISLASVFARNPIWIRGNKDRVKQMLINLVDNAIKYTQEGGSVTVLVEDLKHKVVLRVRDTGIGIAREHIPRIFERFYRVDKSRSRSQGGTGLGLAIVKHIVLSMKGKIEVSSEQGKGTEFIIHIPKNT